MLESRERQLRSVLSAKGCWDEECEIILSPLQIFHDRQIACPQDAGTSFNIIIAWTLFLFSIKYKYIMTFVNKLTSTIAVSNKMSNVEG